MRAFLLYQRHPAADCASTFAAWNGFQSPLRGTATFSTCPFGGHEIWWYVIAESERAAMGQLPGFVAKRTIAIRVASVEAP